MLASVLAIFALCSVQAAPIPPARTAHARFEPVFAPWAPGATSLGGPDTDDPTEDPQPVSEIRVLVFPHLGTYATPQGAEKTADRVQLKSASVCSVFREDGRGSALQTAKTLRFALSTIGDPKLVRCPAAATIVREAGLDSYAYSGDFLIRAGAPTPKPHLEVINILPFESYLKGVVPSEVSADWNMEALKAQAVAARTYGYYELLKTRKTAPQLGYDLDDTVFYQAYLGVSTEDPRTDQAIAATNGEILSYRGGVIKAWFSDDSGGVTETADHAFGLPFPYTLSKNEVYDPALVQSRWSLTSLTPAKMTADLRAAGLLGASQSAAGAEVSSRFATGNRVQTVRVALAGGGSVEISGFNFRLATHLKSTWFSIEPSGAISGRGYGHGVGMSQRGSNALASSLNWDYRKILLFYFDFVDLCVYGSCPLFAR